MTREQQQKVLDNEKLVYHTYYKYIYKSHAVRTWEEDIIQEGFYGLCRAVLNYDPELNIAFSTFAVASIKFRMLYFIKRVVSSNYTTLSLDDLIIMRNDGDSVSYMESLVDRSPSVQENIENKEDLTFIWDLIETSLPATRDSIIAFISSKSLSEAGNKLGISKQAIRSTVNNFTKRCKRVLDIKDEFKEFPHRNDYIDREHYLKDLGRFLRARDLKKFKRNRNYLKK